MKRRLQDWIGKYEVGLYKTSGVKNSRSYVASVDAMLQKFFSKCADKKSLEDYSPLDIGDYIKLRQSENATNYTINRELGAVRTFFNWYLDFTGAEVANPVRYNRLPEVKETKRYVVPKDFGQQLIAMPMGVEDKAFTMCVLEGLSAQELMDLKWDNIPKWFTEYSSQVLEALKDALLGNAPKNVFRRPPVRMLPEKVFRFRTRQSATWRWRKILLRYNLPHVSLPTVRAYRVLRWLQEGVPVSEIRARFQVRELRIAEYD